MPQTLLQTVTGTLWSSMFGPVCALQREHQVLNLISCVTTLKSPHLNNQFESPVFEEPSLLT